MNNLFFDEGGKLRSGWRAAFAAALFVLIAIVLTALTFPAGNALRDSPRSSAVLGALVMLISATVVGVLCSRFFEGLGVKALGVSPTGSWWKNFVAGLGLGAATLVATVFVAVLFGPLGFQFNTFDPAALLGSLAVFAVAAAAEEALFRGYVLQTLARAGYAWPAILLTAAFFGIGHLRNPSSTTIATLTTVLAGVWFGVAYLRTRDLWFVWGMHLAWNWMQGSIFGLEVSGLTHLSGTSLLREIDPGPAWLTGEAYGIEGSIAAVVAIAISALAIYLVPSGINAGDSRNLDFEADVDRTGGVRDAADGD